VQVATTAPQTHRGLLAVGPDIAEVLAVVALRKSSLTSVLHYLDDNMVNVIQLEYLLRVWFFY
jgi:hypothetical protein